MYQKNQERLSVIARTFHSDIPIMPVQYNTYIRFYMLLVCRGKLRRGHSISITNN